MNIRKLVESGDYQGIVVKTLEHMPDNKFKPLVIDGLSNGQSDARTALAALAHQIEPIEYLEIGVWYGWSLFAVASLCSGVNITGIDAWKPNYADVKTASEAHINTMLNTLPLEITENIVKLNILSGTSSNVLPTLSENRYDLIFVDGDHSTAGAILDLDYALTHCVAGGAVVFDDLVPTNEGGNLSMIEVWEMMKIKYPEFEYHDFVNNTVVPFGVALLPAAPKKKRKPAAGNSPAEPKTEPSHHESVAKRRGQKTKTTRRAPTQKN